MAAARLAANDETTVKLNRELVIAALYISVRRGLATELTANLRCRGTERRVVMFDRCVMNVVSGLWIFSDRESAGGCFRDNETGCSCGCLSWLCKESGLLKARRSF